MKKVNRPTLASKYALKVQRMRPLSEIAERGDMIQALYESHCIFDVLADQMNQGRAHVPPALLDCIVETHIRTVKLLQQVAE